MMRYLRQLSIEGFSQEKLSAANVAVIGAGGIGSNVLYQLAAAGIGKLHIFDFDTVDESNLNRQILHFTKDIGREKIASAAEKLSQLNPLIHIETHRVKIDQDSVKLIGEPDIIVDALDNFKARDIVNRYAVEKKIPLIHGAVEELQGRVTTIIPYKSPCLRCIYNRPKVRKSPPVLGTTAALVGILQANEVIKLITGIGEPLIGKLLMIDLKHNEFYSLEIHRQPDCPVCGRRHQNV